MLNINFCLPILQVVFKANEILEYENKDGTNRGISGKQWIRVCAKHNACSIFHWPTDAESAHSTVAFRSIIGREY